jgi:hypothetical protein
MNKVHRIASLECHVQAAEKIDYKKQVRITVRRKKKMAEYDRGCLLTVKSTDAPCIFKGLVTNIREWLVSLRNVP